MRLGFVVNCDIKVEQGGLDEWWQFVVGMFAADTEPTPSFCAAPSTPETKMNLSQIHKNILIEL